MFNRTTNLIIFLGVILFFVGLGKMDFWNTLEARRAIIARNMLNRHDWLIPFLDNQQTVTKPPLVYWAMATSAKIFGKEKEFPYRIPSAVAAIGTLIALFLIGRMLFSEKVGLFAALILATMLLFRWEAQYAELEMMMTFFATLSVYFFFKGSMTDKNKSTYYLLFFASLALAMMSKGPLGMIVPLTPIIVYLILEKRIDTLKEVQWGRGILLFFIITLPWLLYVAYKLGFGYVFGVFKQETGDRYIAAFNHIEPFPYYFSKLDGLFFPWIWLFLICLIILVIKGIGNYRRSKISLPQYFSQLIHSKNGKTLFVIVWFLGNLLFLSFTKAKRYYYILSVTPGFALLAALMWQTVSDNLSFKKKEKLFVFLAPIFLLAGIFSVYTSMHYLSKIQWDLSGRHAPDMFELLQFFGFLLIGFSAIIFSLSNKEVKRDSIFYTIVIAAGLMMLSYSFFAVPVLNKQESPKAFAYKIPEIVPADAPILSFDDKNHAEEFYAKRYLPGTKDKADFDKFFNEHPDGYMLTTMKVWKDVDQSKYTLLLKTETIKDKERSWVLFKKIDNK